MTDIQIGSTVYHAPGRFFGPGIVKDITVLDGKKPITIYHVEWVDHGIMFGHFRRNLLTR